MWPIFFFLIEQINPLPVTVLQEDQLLQMFQLPMINQTKIQTSSFGNTTHKDELSFQSSQAKLQNYSYNLKIRLRQMLGWFACNYAPGSLIWLLE